MARPQDPGLGYDLGCFTSGPVDNCLTGSVLPDAIKSLEDPKFIPVNDASFANGERIFMIEAAGQVFGFPQKIMNAHEVATFSVVDETGETIRTSATWCPLALSFVEWRKEWTGGRLKRASFGVSGALVDNNLVLYDRETNTHWVQILGYGMWGPQADECLEPGRNNAEMSFGLFQKMFPAGRVLDYALARSAYEQSQTFYRDYWLGEAPAFKVTNLDRRKNWNDPVFAVHGESGESAAFLVTQPVTSAELGETPVVVLADIQSQTYFAFDSRLQGRTFTFTSSGKDDRGVPLFKDDQTGSTWRLDGVAVEGDQKGKRLPQLPAFKVFWFAWASLHPGTELIRP